MTAYPLLLEPILKPKVWGGRWLEHLGKRLPPGELIGESWELADLPPPVAGGECTIANSPWKGWTLHRALETHRDLIMGDAKLSPQGRFPLLVKYLDAQQNLSVQVHPDAAYAAAHPETHLKSEAWVVIHAEPHGVIYKGVKPSVTREEFVRHIHTGEVVNDLIKIPVKPGDCHYLPSGTCHALGAGVVVAEVQTPSDTTFRVYDWGRSGPGRELHIEQAMECIHFGTPPLQKPPAKPYEVNGLRTTPLVETDYFAVQRLETLGNSGRITFTASGLPMIFMMLQGRVEIISQASTRPVTPLAVGTTILIPAAVDSIQFMYQEPATFLRIELPSPLKGMIA